MLFQNICYESLPVYQYSFISSKKTVCSYKCSHCKTPPRVKFSNFNTSNPKYHSALSPLKHFVDLTPRLSDIS